MWDVGCEVSNTVYRLLFTVYDFNDLPLTAYCLLFTVLMGTNVAHITQPSDKYTAPLGRVEPVDPLLAAVELV
jgi:hypothetical protein